MASSAAAPAAANSVKGPGAGGDMGNSNQKTSPDKKNAVQVVVPAGAVVEEVLVVEQPTKAPSDKEENKSNGAHTPA